MIRPFISRRALFLKRATVCLQAVCWALLSMALLFSAEQSSGEEAPAEAAIIDRAELESRIERLRQQTTFPEETRGKLLELYRNGLELLRSANNNRAQREQFLSSLKEIPERLAKLRAEEGAMELPSEERAGEASLPLMEKTLAQLETSLATTQNRLRQLEAQPQERADREIEIARQLAKLRTELQEMGQRLGAEVGRAASEELREAAELVRRLKQQSLEARIEAFQEELRFYEASDELLHAELTRTAREAGNLSQAVEAWRRIIAQRRQAAAQQDLRRANAETAQVSQASGEHPKLLELAEENEALVEQRLGPNGLASKLGEAGRRLAATQEKLHNLEAAWQRARKRLAMIKGAGVPVDEAVGHLLRDELKRLPGYEVSSGRLAEQRDEISATLASLIALQDERIQLNFPEARGAQLVTSFVPAPSSSAATNLQAAAVELLKARRDYLDRLIDVQKARLNKLMELELAAREINRLVAEFSAFISENVLWIRSAPPLSWHNLQGRLELFASYWPASGWPAAARQLAKDFHGATPLYLLALLVTGLLFGCRGWAQRRLKPLNEQAQDRENTDLRITIEALLLAALPLAGWLLPVVFVGWRLSLVVGIEPELFVLSLGLTFGAISRSLFILLYVRSLCAPDGIAAAHFQWPQSNLELIRRHLTWFIALSLPCTFVVGVIERQNNDATVGHVIFFLQMLLIAGLAQALLRPQGGLSWGEDQEGEEVSVSWARKAYYGLGLGIPLLLIVLAYLGYYYSALELSTRFVFTLYIVIGLVLLRAVLLRWLEVARQRVVQEERRRHQEAKQQQDSGAAPPAPRPRRFSLAEVIMQSRSLLHTGLWLLFLALALATWSSSIPALRALDQIPVPLLSRPAETRETEPVRTGSSDSLGNSLATLDQPDLTQTDRALPASSPPALRGVSLGDLLIAVLMLLVAVAAMRNLPGLLQLALLNRLDLRPGVGYAITTLVRYGVILLAILLICDRMGLTWSKMQWIAAAFSLGIAFGLQEIFANFISGLIILFERPIRLGDIVTVGDVSGNVTRINIRATTITDWDRREFLVPNKEFITGKLLNWTLSDPITRVLVPVGIAYGSDTELAERLLLEAAQENPHVMPDPPPRAIFWGFGDNSLEFRLYVHIPRRNFYFDLLHALTNSINRKFRENKITIAFPQRDIHLHATRPLEVRVLPSDPKET